ncbi:tetratricopeptide repeat protein [Halomicronema sp. CCY15110]|uniref:tetratricopeptide repeat protein n=1 Tax=Halomicronema sp. CCY15110 TaxID=2767773 RepID=UPI00194E97F5|nr:tetratricopeptide repeat protein [Halomicronema sp. CCY15110]
MIRLAVVFSLYCYTISLGACTTTEVRVPLRSPLVLSPQAQEQLAYPVFLMDADGAAAYRQQGLAARQQEDFEGAIAALNTAVILDPLHVPGYVLLGWTQHLAGDRDVAIATLNQGLTRDAEHVPGLNALGIAYLVNGDLEAAIAAHTQAKTLQADNEIAYYNLSLAYQRLPDVSAAIAHAERATELEPDNPHPWVALALAHWSKPDPVAAVASYRQALQLDGRYYDAAHLENLLKAGFSPEQIEQVDEIRIQI